MNSSVRTMGLLAGFLTVSASLAIAVQPPVSIAAAMVLPFLLVAPGLAWLAVVDHLRIEERIVVSIALSLALNIAVASVLALTGHWSPEFGFAILIILTIAGLMVADLRTRRFRK